MAKKYGYQKGFPKGVSEVKLTEGPKLNDTEKGKEITEVWTDNDLGAIRGTRDGFA